MVVVVGRGVVCGNKAVLALTSGSSGDSAGLQFHTGPSWLHVPPTPGSSGGLAVSMLRHCDWLFVTHGKILVGLLAVYDRWFHRRSHVASVDVLRP